MGISWVGRFAAKFHWGKLLRKARSAKKLMWVFFVKSVIKELRNEIPTEWAFQILKLGNFETVRNFEKPNVSFYVENFLGYIFVSESFLRNFHRF